MRIIHPNSIALLALALSGVAFAQSAGSGSMNGTASDEQGSHVAANIFFQRLTKSYRPSPLSNRVSVSPGEIEVRNVIATNADGTFQVANLPAGAYVVCAHPLDDQYVDSCDWDPPAHVVIGNGAAALASLTHFRAGVQVIVHIVDPQSLLPTANGFLSIPGLIVGVRDSTRKFHAALAKTAGQGYRELSVTVPTGTNVTLIATGHRFILKDSGGTVVPPNGGSTPLRIPPTPSAVTVDLTVAGRQ